MFDGLHIMLLKILLSTLLGGLVGLERERQGRAAGLRTHILVCLGSTLFTICSFEIAGDRADPGRIAAQIVTGVGFLGAGTIMRQGSIVIGLTSAASIWGTAAIGLTIGIGGKMAAIGTASAIIVYTVLHYPPMLDILVSIGRKERIVTLRVSRVRDEVARAREMLKPITKNIRIRDMKRVENKLTEISLRIELTQPGDVDRMISILENSKWVVGFSVE